MKFRVRLSQLFFLGILSVSLLGCGGGADKFKKARPKTVPAAATVTYKGSPVVGATVVFHPVQGTHAAAGMTDSSGRVVLKTFPPEEGAVPGNYTVTVSLLEQSAMPVLPDGVHAEDVKLPKAKSLIPFKYSLPESSGLMAVVPDEGNEEMTVELTE
jgi:hypothetical protein